MKGSLLTTLLSAAFICIFYWSILINADRLNFEASGDGYKNYYTLAYYLKYDSGVHFSGMNYPYGEHVMFTDNQPAIAWILKGVSLIYPSISNHLHGFIVFAVFISLVIASLFVYKTLREFKVSEWLAVTFAILIGLLSPQLQRVFGHFSLAYSFFLPVLIFLIVRYFKTNGNFRFFLWITVLILFFSFVHVYYLAIAGMFIFGIVFLHFIKNIRKQIKNLFWFESLLLASFVIPFAVLKIFLSITDKISDRPEAPWGFFANQSTLADIILSNNSFTGQGIASMFPQIKFTFHFEGYGYIGCVALLTLLIALYRRINKPNPVEHTDNSNEPLNYMFPAAILVLLFAMALPFSIDPIKKFYDYLPGLIKQFRAPGRFNWVFYYMATIQAAILLSTWYEQIKLKHKTRASIFISLALFIWVVELILISNRMVSSLRSNAEVSNEKEESENLHNAFQNTGKLIKDFQAILPLPFFLNGSEKIYLEPKTAFQDMKISLFTGLPLVCGQLSRTSERQSFKMVNLLSHPVIQKEIINEYPDEKPLLLVVHDNNRNGIEQDLINRSAYLFNLQHTAYYELPISVFQEVHDSVIKDIFMHKELFIEHPGFKTTVTTLNVVHKGYENQPNDFGFGKGCFVSNSEITMLYNDVLPSAVDSVSYEFSVWLFSDNRRAAFPIVYLTQEDAEGNILGDFKVDPKLSTNTHGKWVRAQIDFTLYNHNNTIKIWAKGKFGSFDELLIRPADVQVLSDYVNDSRFMYNNYPFRQKETK